MIVCPCGCRNAPDETYGVLRCVSKCSLHRLARSRQASGRRYYQKLGSVADDGAPVCEHYVQQFVEGFGSLRPAPGVCAHALEIGGGASPYVRLLESCGYHYLGIDPDRWAAEWLEEHYDAVVDVGPFPAAGRKYKDRQFSLILAAHSVEHLPDAPDALLEVRRLLSDDGRLYLLLPDDSDLVNPDHFWFFTPDTLRALMRRLGFAERWLHVRRYVDKERFIYSIWSKACELTD